MKPSERMTSCSKASRRQAGWRPTSFERPTATSMEEGHKIRRRRDGSIDMDHYVRLGRLQRSRAVTHALHRAIRSLRRMAKRLRGRSRRLSDVVSTVRPWNDAGKRQAESTPPIMKKEQVIAREDKP